MNKTKFTLSLLAVILGLAVIFAGFFLSIRITTGPVVFECGTDEYAVVWATSLKGSGYVKYTYEGEEKILWDSQGGTIATDDKVHMVKVPKQEFQNNTYCVGSRYVLIKMGYHAIKGKNVESDKISFNGEEKQDGIRALSISDIHGMTDEMMKSVSYFEDTPDIIFMIGDISSELITQNYFIERILDNASLLSKGETPVVYVRGNHETRGEYASQMIQYFPTATGEHYFTFDFGGLSVIALDSGEDKEDDHKEYSGLVDFAFYRQQELKWINSLEKEDFDGKYKIVLCHNPMIGTDYFGKDWETPLKNLEADLVVGGHEHTVKLVEGDLPRLVDGGKLGEAEKGKNWAASMLYFENGKIAVKTINCVGETIFSEEIEVE